MNDLYSIRDTSQLISPGYVIFRDLVHHNIQRMITIAGDAQRLRPHCKTHKTAEILVMERELGIDKAKCATFAEAEMAAEAGIQDVFLAYSLVGPNIGRAVAFVEKFPQVNFMVTADHERPIRELGQAMSASNTSVGVLLDMDTGQHRTGLPPGEAAGELYQLITETPGLTPAGLHLYDGHNHQTPYKERHDAVLACWQSVAELRDTLVAAGHDVPRIVAGGTGSFPCFASIDDPALELSPGTCVLHDRGYGEAFPDLDFTPAAVILTRVISRPTANRVTFDLGYKACASDPPKGNRLYFPQIPDATEVLQNEEHLVIETSRADEFQPGDEQFAIPRHVCPTSALHQYAHVVVDGEVVERWAIASRDRCLTV